ncbi:type II CAAX prenyl endopeptidase Rce1 family protein [uncultured Methanobrevibacter sp.]|uniref:CPBP family glutamic-type intramembrane protease n=1 Tax=uncultured Methanobrevibacter sp. TaxID=253161 RepID=UPI0025E3A342|nr:CPBP family glutamic-type intramembrane protease [uncultured Methanobrevibacter sp.]
MLNLDNDRDFPFYNEIPKMSKLGWLVLLICVPTAYLINRFQGFFGNEIICSIIFALVLLVPLLYFSNWNYSLFFQKPTKNEIILAVAMGLAYIIYSSIFTTILYANKIPDVSNINPNIITLISLIFFMLGEELMKFIPLMFFLRVFYKYSSNRTLSVIASSAITLIFFGLIHLEPGISILSVLLIQAAGSIFHLYAYLKTKNLFVSYLAHLITDMTVISAVMLGFF